MKFNDLLNVVADEPVFETGLLLAGDLDPGDVQRQLSRWVAAKRLLRLRRGLYALAPPYRKVKPHPFVVANHLQRGSYVSLQSALAYYGLIPEHVPVTTSVGFGDTRRWQNPLGRFTFRHLSPAIVGGYLYTEVVPDQWALLARPEKALLDLVYLEPRADRAAYLHELRLQNLESLDLASLQSLAEATAKPKLRRAARRIAELATLESTEYEAV